MTSSERESELAAENARLKRQLAEQAEVLAILQKAATYFAKRLKLISKIILNTMINIGRETDFGHFFAVR